MRYGFVPCVFYMNLHSGGKAALSWNGATVRPNCQLDSKKKAEEKCPGLQMFGV